MKISGSGDKAGLACRGWDQADQFAQMESNGTFFHSGEYWTLILFLLFVFFSFYF
jgi:hypothetical protein